MKAEIVHHQSCRADYPEKPEGEPAQHLISIDIGDGERVIQCADCGAYVIVREEES